MCMRLDQKRETKCTDSVRTHDRSGRETGNVMCLHHNYKLRKRIEKALPGQVSERFLKKSQVEDTVSLVPVVDTDKEQNEDEYTEDLEALMDFIISVVDEHIASNIVSKQSTCGGRIENSKWAAVVVQLSAERA
eukprot:TRINITY_DN14885_c0_g1_i1.p2 TRINITY_DN14885_c0_g1~~TRINITY_DN14885_c0_g1_i1.p2  ORF type:complete len:134 (+),score=11.87 TRINITY_DN14885_c0_g1_i1:801-1202(+)